MAKSICGTMVYIAPEVLSGNEYSVEVDFWALGCLIYEMCTG
jgi:serine/threonine protein kinase